MAQERQPSPITKSRARLRSGIRHVMSGVSRFPQTRILHQEVQGSEDGVEKADRLLDEGYGLIVVVPHDSFRDFLENMNFIFPRGVLGERRIDIPLAKHQYDNPFFNLTAKLFKATIDVHQHPVVTERTKEKLAAKTVRESGIGKIVNFLGPIKTPQDVKDLTMEQKLKAAKDKLHSQEAPLMNHYFGEACENLNYGGIVFMAPQATRSSELKLSKRTLGTFLTAATGKKGVDPEKIAIFFLGHEIKDVIDYSQKGLTGFNRGRTFIMRPGSCFTLPEALVASGGLRTIDAWAVEQQLSKLVSPHFLSPDLRQKLSTT